MSEILFGQKYEVGKMEKMLYEQNETLSNLISMKELARNELQNLEKENKNAMAVFHTENKLSKRIIGVRRRSSTV